jgi:hypothetical protein
MSNGTLWSPDDTSSLRRLVASGMTDVEIGQRMDRNARLIRAKRKEHGFAPGTSRPLRAILARINLRRMRARA